MVCSGRDGLVYSFLKLHFATQPTQSLSPAKWHMVSVVGEEAVVGEEDVELTMLTGMGEDAAEVVLIQAVVADPEQIRQPSAIRGDVQN